MSTIIPAPRHPHHSETERIRQVWIKGSYESEEHSSTAAENHISKVVPHCFFENKLSSLKQKGETAVGIGLQNTKTHQSFL